MSVECQSCRYVFNRVSVCWKCGHKFCWNCAPNSSQMNGSAECPECGEWTEKQTES